MPFLSALPIFSHSISHIPYEILILHVAQGIPGKNLGEGSGRDIRGKSLAIIVAGIIIGTTML